MLSNSQLHQQPNHSNVKEGLNPYALEYLNTVKENRSVYGNFVDNALAYDPYKEQKSVYNVVYETDAYNPWGKPGGGAPKLDNNTGQLNTKIAGTLRWNLNGETEEDRMKRLMNAQKTNKNLLMYRKNPPSPGGSPRQPLPQGPNERQATTYNYNYRDPSQLSLANSVTNSMHFMQQPPMPNASLPPINNQNMMNNHLNTSNNQFFNSTQIEREAFQRTMEKKATRNMPPQSKSNDKSLTGPSYRQNRELNRISNKLYNDNDPTNDYPNNTYWFGRAGPLPNSISANSLRSTSDFSSLQQQQQQQQQEQQHMNNFPQMDSNQNDVDFKYVNSAFSNHRNNYEYQMKMN